MPPKAWQPTHEKERLEMNKTKRHLLLVMLVLAMLAVPTLVVFAKELGSLTISGPGIKGEITLNDPNNMMKLEQSGFFDQALLAKAPKDLNLEAGYTITATLNLDGKAVQFAKIVYYPTNEGQSAYLHYLARYQGDALQSVDEWDVLSRDADSVIRGLMTANNITVHSALAAASVKAEAPAPAASSAQPVTAPITPRSAVQTPYLVLGISVALILLLGAGMLLRQRTVSASS
jgi:hypothetical protein